jgi:hypothetical protein
MEVLNQTEMVEEIGRRDHDELDPSVSVDGVAELHDTLDSMADSLDVSGFKCVNCGLVHGHDTTKHRATDTFDIDAETAASMDANPNCHCGPQELARRGDDYGVDEQEAAGVASKAPVADEVSREMDEAYGSL